MLRITVPGQELWDELNEEFVYLKEQTLQLEHSLVSLSKWESKWHKPFISNIKTITNEEMLDYVRCMTITQNVDPRVYMFLTEENIIEIYDYINNPMTATTFRKTDNKQGVRKRIITSELIYYWMITLNIPSDFQKWHLNRLITLIEVCNEENKPAQKVNKREQARNYAQLNRERRARLNSKG